MSAPEPELSAVEVERALGALLDDDPEAFYERAPCGYISATPVGTIVKVNQTFLDWTGYRREDLVGQRSFVDLLSAGGRIFHETHYRPLLDMQGSVREIAVDLVGADDRRLPALVNSVLERDEAGHPVIIRTAVFDATERRRYERDLVAAKQRAEQAEADARVVIDTIQRSLTPPALPAVDGLELAAVYRPVGDGGDLGGDFYDAVSAVDGSWLVVVGDVLGKGVEAAVVTGLARHALQAAALCTAEPREVLAVLNEVLRRSGLNRFVTVALLKFANHADRRTLTVALGGHHPPLICRPDQAPVPIGEPGSLLGVFADPTFPQVEVDIGPGDLVVSCTDGITEARQDTEFFGEDGLRRAVERHRSSARAATEGVLADALEFSGGRRDDDIVVVAVRAT